MRAGAAMSTQRPSPRRFELFFFSLPQAPLLALSLALIVFLPPHFATHLDMPLEQVSALFLAARLLDLGLGPALGHVQDATRLRFGRRRVWLAAVAPLLMLLAWLAFAGLEGARGQAWAQVVVLGLYAALGAMMIAHLSWAGELRPDYHGRTRVLGAAQAAGAVGQLAVLALPAYVVWSGWGGDVEAAHALGWALVLALPVSVALAVGFTREAAIAPQRRLSLKQTLALIGANRPLRIVLAVSLLIGIAQGLSGGLFVFYFQYRLGFEREAHALLLIFFIAGLAGVPLWVWLGQRFGKHKALQGACIYSAAATAMLPILPAGLIAVAAPGMFAAGLAQGAGVMLVRAMLADVVDEDENQCGALRSGLFFGLLLTATKIGLALGPIAYAMLAWAGFDANLGRANSAAAMGALEAIFVGGPVLFSLSAAFVLRGYGLNEARQAELRACIEANRRDASERAKQPD